MKKIIAFGLSLMLVFQLSIPAVAMTFPGSAEAEKAENVNTIMSEELIELREPNSKTFQLSNGTYECIIYAEDMHYEDGRGNLSEIDNSIVRESYSFGDVTYAYRNAANKNIVHFAETEPKICISAPKGLLEFSFVNSEDTVATIGNHYSMHEFSICSLDGDNYIAYPDVYTQTDMVYAVENDLVKEYIILKGKNAPAKFLFRFNTEGLSVRKSDGVVQFYDEADTIVFELEKLFAVDAAGAYTNALEYNVIGTDGQFIENLNSVNGIGAIEEKVRRIYPNLHDYEIEDRTLVVAENGRVGVVYRVDVEIQDKSSLDEINMVSSCVYILLQESGGGSGEEVS